MLRSFAPVQRLGGLLSTRRFAAQVLDGKQLRSKILDRVSQETALLPKPPGLTVIQVGGHADSTVYVTHKLSAARACGMAAKHVKLPRHSTESDILAIIRECNNDPSTHGMLLQLPLDTNQDVNQDACLNAIDPAKDVDGLHPINAGLLSHGDLDNCLLPCTPKGCMELIKSTGRPIAGASAVVLGRSAIVGTPMAELLKWNDATVTVCHSKTTNIIERTRQADIVVAACRQRNMVTADWIKPGAIVIDVGIHSIPDPTKKSGYRITGDVDYKSASQVAGWITPVPGHVGPMTVAMVVQNTLECAKRLMADQKSYNSYDFSEFLSSRAVQDQTHEQQFPAIPQPSLPNFPVAPAHGVFQQH